MGSKIKVLIASAFAIVGAAALIVAGTYALFSDSISIDNHLQAGTLKVKLERTSLKWAELNPVTGYLVEQTDNEVKDFTKSSTLTENVFGLEDEVLVVPNSFYEATLKLSNNGSVAFDYTVKIVLTSNSNALAEQLKVTVDGDTVNAKLLSDGETILVSGTMDKTVSNSAKSFTIRIEFINQNDNNDAQDLTVDFDLIVTAIQRTTE
ncbi:hypothetical protein IY230_01645 [Acholeplasma laidlawii]|nr:hypothetical protein [Acholeplasma laidlawii]